MFPAQIPQTGPDKLIRFRDSSQSISEERGDSKEAGKADAALAHKVGRALWNDNVLRAIEYDEIDVRVINGVVYLHGHIVSTTSQSRIINSIQAVPGILRIENNLVLDDKLTLEVATSLGELEHIYDCKFFTGSSHGVISLNGIVKNEDVKLLAEKCVADNPNVRGVINNIRVADAELAFQEEPFLQPAIGKVIYFLDGVSGVVKQVIINPNNRRVIAISLQGIFADQRSEPKSSADGNTRIPEQLVTVPMNVVRYLTKESGFLSIACKERNRYMDFNSASFSSPGRDWVPPYPYCSDDVLFPINQQEIKNRTLKQIPPSSFSIPTKEQLLWEQLLTNDGLGG